MAENRPAWRIVDASVIGPHHLRNGLPNQDATGNRSLGSGACVLAVADGAGSATRSDEGSQVAVSAALDAAEEMMRAGRPTRLHQWQRFAEGFARAALRNFDEALRGAPARADFATTLLAAVVAPPWFVWVSVGDGFLVVDRDPGGVHLVVAPPTDREFQGETTFLTSADRLAALRYDVLLDPLARGLALCTDGLMEGLLTLESNPPLPAAPPEMVAYFDYVRDRTKESAGLERTLASPEFAATSGDDKTIAMVVRL